MTQQAEDKKGPGLRFPPPLLPATLLGIAWIVDQWIPIPIGGDIALFYSAIALLVFALALALTALFQFFRAGTHVEPWQPTSTIIESGLFRFSRNPIYLAFCIATLGGGMLFDSWWGIAAVPLLMYLLQLLVIRREEEYLESKFGELYLGYKRRVRRWL